MENRIKELRTLANIKQIDLCAQLGVTQGALSGWENGRYEPDNKSLIKMADIFGVSIDYLIGRTDDKNQKSGETNIKFDEFSYAMYNESKELSDDDKQRLLTFARMLKTSIAKDEELNKDK